MRANCDENHWAWKGDGVGYGAIHSWVYRRLGKAQKCSDCGTTEGRIEWANISGHYYRDLSDWRSLCKRCHYQFDLPRWGSAKAYYAPELAVA